MPNQTTYLVVLLGLNSMTFMNDYIGRTGVFLVLLFSLC